MSAQAQVLGVGPQAIAESPRSLRWNAVWNLAGNVFYAICQWALISVLAKRGGSGQVGEFALGLSITAPVFMFGNLQLRAIQTTDARNAHSFADYLGLRLATSVVSVAVSAAAAFLLSGSTPLRLAVCAVALAKAVEAVADIHQGVMQKHERMDLLAVSLVLKGAASLVAFAAVYSVSHSVIWAALAMAAAQSITLLAYDAPRALRFAPGRLLKPVWRPNHIRTILAGALPLGVSMLLVSLQTNLPRLSIQKHLGIADLGIFAAITYFSIAGAMVINAVGGAAAPRLAAHWSQSDVRGFRQLLANMAFTAFLLGAAGVAGSLVFGKEILQALYGREYALHSGVLVWTMVSAGISFIASMLGYAATAMGRFREQPVVLAVVTGALLAACAVLVPRHGLLGAAWAMSASSCLCLALFTHLVLRRYVRTY
jgi:O-antigen/teichoic acid export membrane protein